MKKEHILIGGIPAIVWGDASESVYIYVHGKLSSKDAAESFAEIANTRGYQTLSFDLPSHGDRRNICSIAGPEECNIFTGIRDLTSVGEHADGRWSRQSLYGCSIGAYFALHAYFGRRFENVLLQSPIVDMLGLVNGLFTKYGISEEMLREKRRIYTPVEILNIDHYDWIVAHPLKRWDSPISVLYAGRDDLQSRKMIDEFCVRFSAKLTVSPSSLHPFMDASDGEVVAMWLRENI